MRRSSKLRKIHSIKGEALAQVYSCKFCEIFKNSFFHRTPPVSDSFSKSSQKTVGQ